MNALEALRARRSSTIVGSGISTSGGGTPVSSASSLSGSSNFVFPNTFSDASSVVRGSDAGSVSGGGEGGVSALEKLRMQRRASSAMSVQQPTTPRMAVGKPPSSYNFEITPAIIDSGVTPTATPPMNSGSDSKVSDASPLPRLEVPPSSVVPAVSLGKASIKSPRGLGLTINTGLSTISEVAPRGTSPTIPESSSIVIPTSREPVSHPPPIPPVESTTTSAEEPIKLPGTSLESPTEGGTINVKRRASIATSKPELETLGRGGLIGEASLDPPLKKSSNSPAFRGRSVTSGPTTSGMLDAAMMQRTSVTSPSSSTGNSLADVAIDKLKKRRASIASTNTASLVASTTPLKINAFTVKVVEEEDGKKSPYVMKDNASIGGGRIRDNASTSGSSLFANASLEIKPVVTPRRPSAGFLGSDNASQSSMSIKSGIAEAHQESALERLKQSRKSGSMDRGTLDMITVDKDSESFGGSISRKLSDASLNAPPGFDGIDRVSMGSGTSASSSLPGKGKLRGAFASVVNRALEASRNSSPKVGEPDISSILASTNVGGKSKGGGALEELRRQSISITPAAHSPDSTDIYSPPNLSQKKKEIDDRPPTERSKVQQPLTSSMPTKTSVSPSIGGIGGLRHLNSEQYIRIHGNISPDRSEDGSGRCAHHHHQHHHPNTTNLTRLYNVFIPILCGFSVLVVILYTLKTRLYMTMIRN